MANSLLRIFGTASLALVCGSKPAWSADVTMDTAAKPKGIRERFVPPVAGIDLDAGCAFSARHGGHAGFAVERLGDDPGERSLADSARAGQQIGVVQPVLRKRIADGAHHMFLADQFSEISRAPFTRQRERHIDPRKPDMSIWPRRTSLRRDSRLHQIRVASLTPGTCKK